MKTKTKYYTIMPGCNWGFWGLYRNTKYLMIKDNRNFLVFSDFSTRELGNDSTIHFEFLKEIPLHEAVLL